MPMNRSLYPKDWKTIALAIKEEAGWKCEQCDRPCRPTGTKWMHFANDLINLGWITDGEELNHPQRFTLTVSHTDHQPENCTRSNLRALCAPCHCRYDLLPSSMSIKKRLKAERNGQLTLGV